MLAVSGLRKHYQLQRPAPWWRKAEPPVAVPAVEEVSFSVARGEVLAVVGESGCGKTTVARMLVGLTEPSAGTVSVGGHHLGGQRSLADRRLIQLVSQDPWSALNRGRTVGHALEQPLVVHEPQLSRPERTRKVAAFSERVNLSTAHLRKRPGALSGGELARAVLARALLAQPKVVVLDEPTASLDASVKATVVNLLLDLQAELGLCLVLITHEIPVARRLADRAAVMYLGRFVETGPARQVLRTPTHPYTRMLLASAPAGGPGRHPLPVTYGEIPSAVNIPTGCSYHPRCHYRAEVCTGTVPELAPHGAGSVACLRIAHLEPPADPRRSLAH